MLRICYFMLRSEMRKGPAVTRPFTEFRRVAARQDKPPFRFQRLWPLVPEEVKIDMVRDNQQDDRGICHVRPPFYIGG